VNCIENQKGTGIFEDHFEKWKQLTEISIEPTPTMSGGVVENPERPESGHSSPECRQLDSPRISP